MTTIYKYQDSETAITQDTTAPLLASDPLLVYSNTLSATRQATIGSASCLMTATAATSATTGTNISSYGYTSLGSSSGPVTAWMLTSPFTAGVIKQIVSISTSTAHTVTLSTTDHACVIYSTANTIGRTATFSAPGSYLELTSQSTAIWIVTGKAATTVVT